MNKTQLHKIIVYLVNLISYVAGKGDKEQSKVFSWLIGCGLKNNSSFSWQSSKQMIQIQLSKKNAVFDV